MSHTPTPWEINDSRWPNCIVAPKAAPGALSLARVCEYAYLKPEDARFIVQAVNSHAQLVEACKAVMLWAMTPGEHGGNPYCKKFVKLSESALRAAGEEIEP